MREAEEPIDGRFVIFLPTEMATGTGAHVNAPFYGSLDRRRILFKDSYNRLLLDCVLDLSLDAVAGLAATVPEVAQARAIVDILSSVEQPGRRDGREHAGFAVRVGPTTLAAALEGCRLILCDG